jgi:SAM-dependent methyltransferase
MQVNDSIESRVRKFYENIGWRLGPGQRRTDYTLWEDSRPVASWYQANCRRRLASALERGDNRLLDAGSGPVQHVEFDKVHRKFAMTVLLDLSHSALAAAPYDCSRTKVCGTVSRMPFRDGWFDAVMCVNVINHVDRGHQRRSIIEMLRVLRPGGRLAIVSYNPHRVRLSRLQLTDAGATSRQTLYWSAPSPQWWAQFSTVARVRIRPFRFLFVTDLKRCIPAGMKGCLLLRLVAILETLLPSLAVRHGAYYLVILDKKG